MKRLPFILSLFFISSLFFVHAQRVTYAYDASGNRVSRTITLSGSSRSAKAQSEEAAEPALFSEKLGEREIKIYPNPTKGHLAVEISGGNDDDNIKLTLHNLQGVLLHESKMTTDIVHPLDLSAYPPAIYILRLHTGENEVTDYKIIKQ